MKASGGRETLNGGVVLTLKFGLITGRKSSVLDKVDVDRQIITGKELATDFSYFTSYKN